jgi:NADH:ubiquinone oxidoreductase subunit 5 (subunit L)/multisubunit Na+/H+ antiporter MnhA subunit
MEKLLLAVVIIPVIGPFFLPPLAQVSNNTRNFFAIIIAAITFVINIFLTNSAFLVENIKYIIPFPLGFELVLKLDPLSAFMATVSSLTSLVIVIYSIDYISHYENQTEYYTMIILFMGSMMGLVYSDNLVWMYIFWEITAFTSWRLVGFFRSDWDVLKANKTILVTVFGALLMLIGIIHIYVNYNTLSISHLKAKEIQFLPAFLILMGIFSKSAILPFSTWLPDAGVAPSTVTAFLHAAVLVKIGTFAYAKLFGTTFITSVEFNYTVLIISALTAIVSGGAALVETDIKRIIAYSTISQLSFIFLGLASGSKTAFAGGLLYILMHSIAKAALFLCAGIIEQKTHTKDITKMGGLIKTMPVTALAFALSSFSVMGLPPFGGFFGKFLVFKGAIETNDIAMVTLFFIGAILTMLYLSRLFYKIFLGNEKFNTPFEGSPTMVTSVLFLALLGLVLGIMINYPFTYTEMTSQLMYMGVK